MSTTDTYPVPALVEGTKALGPPRMPMPPASMHHALKAYSLMGGRATRATATGMATAKLLAFGMTAETWNELWQMQAAAWQRQQQLQVGWVQGWAAWIEEWSQVKGANTMSKLVEQEFNLVAQLGQLLSGQATDLVTLQENIEVDYAYWVSEKLR